jgi:thiol:disulfide interchange protein DsbC
MTLPLFRLAASLLLAAGLTACAPELDEDTDAAAAKPAAANVAPGDELAQLRAKLAKTMPDVKPEDVTPTAAAGLYQVHQGNFYGYVSADGTFLIQGDMVNIQTGEQVTENQRKGERVARLQELGADNMIEFAPAKPQDTKYTITVFTDVDCGYCRKLHSEMAQYNQLGIAVRYVFYPRSGPQSSSFVKAEQIWCAQDRKAALTQAKLGQPTAAGEAKCDNPILREWQLGQDFGLRGTPMLVLPDGEVVNGYVPAPDLAQRLAQIEAGPDVAATDGGTQVR